MKPNRRLFWFVVATIALCAILGGVYGSQVEATSDNAGESDIQTCLRKFTQVYEVVQQNYAVPLNADNAIFGPAQSLTLGAIPGMLRTLDPHSNFFSPKAFQNLRLDQEGKYFGVGMAIQLRLNSSNNLAPVVAYTFPGSPAARAGLRAGDVILKVDRKTTAGLRIDQVANMLKGPKGTLVGVTVSRVGFPKLLSFRITRAAISQMSVDRAFMIRPGVAYIHIRNFDETTNRELTADLARLDAPHLHGLILDLRNNPGGLLRQAVEVAGHFLQKGQLIVYHYGRSSPERKYYAVTGNHGDDYPMVVLIDGNTASAAEIVTGALQDHDRALVIGTTSFGKGLVQTVYPLSDHAGLALTTAHYYTPSGRLIQRDYSGISLWDYFNHDSPDLPSHAHVYYTDGGRKVYGGGGITPDVVFKPPALTAVERTLLDHFAFFNFAKGYLVAHPRVPKVFVPDAALLQDFSSFLKKEKIPVSSADLQANKDYINLQLRDSILIQAYGQQEENRLLVESNPLVQKALSELPEAAQLVANAKRYMASRSIN